MTTKLTAKELRSRLKAAVKATMAEGRQLRLDREAALAAGDRAKAFRLREEQVLEYRPRARALYLAYAFLKGRTYNQVEPNFDPDRYPPRPTASQLKAPLVVWEGDRNLIEAWLEAGDKTRFELEEEAAQDKAPLSHVPVQVVQDTPKGVLGRLRAAVGV